MFVGHPDDDDPFHLVNHARSGELEAAGVGWDAVAAVLKPRVDVMFSDATWRTWFGEAVPRKLKDGVLTITVSDWFTVEWIEGHFAEEIAAAAAAVEGVDRVLVRYASGFEEWRRAARSTGVLRGRTALLVRRVRLPRARRLRTRAARTRLAARAGPERPRRRPELVARSDPR